MAAERMKTVEDRKARKPLLERKRRARINGSLSELKDIVLRSLNKDSSRYTKMEKADILEMAVKHLKALKETVNEYSRQHPSAHYRNGFTQCATEMTRHVMTMDTIDESSRSDILSHLNSTCQTMLLTVPQASPSLSPLVSKAFAHSKPHENPCYHCQPLLYPPPNFLNGSTELPPRFVPLSPQPFNSLVTPNNHITSSQKYSFDKYKTKSLSDSSLEKLSQNNSPSSISATFSHCSISKSISPKTTESTSIPTPPSVTCSEPVWRPW
ncbi:transcription factor HES-2-like isoform X2 [Xenia sp. Carnegie-2017]|uniref:transcription factor HES-2-like isoform X2 n=1 Tax=Xenia sp. Carnegie-2017 TaxID=2897299 RepID=UPI001F037B9C|nr:transcription factor HES-2-like isoform X2 [Xenia sp. Carnegie-2017]